MSHPIGKTGARIRTGSLVVLGIGVLLFIASSLVPASGAWFNDAKTGHATISTASFGLSVSNADGTSSNGTFALVFKDLVPGSSATQSFTVKNTGSIAGNVVLDSGATISGGNGYDLSDLSYTMAGYGAVSLASGYHPPLSLGTLQPGESKTYTLSAALARSAGNEWQGVTIDNSLGVILSQS